MQWAVWITMVEPNPAIVQSRGLKKPADFSRKDFKDTGVLDTPQLQRLQEKKFEANSTL